MLIALLAAGSSLVWSQNLLENASFEETVPRKVHRWKVDLVKGWSLNLNSGQKKCRISLVEPGSSGKKALQLKTIGASGFCSASYVKPIAVKAGQQITASVKMRGNGYGYLRIYFLDAQGKRLKQYKMLGQKGTADWKDIIIKFTVPEGVGQISYSLQTLKDNAEISFDEASLVIKQGDVLENKNLKLVFNPRIGGGIDSFYWKPGKIELTNPNKLAAPGGLMNVIIPARRLPGLVLYNPYKTVEISKNKAVYSTSVNSGQYKGLELKKEYQLLDNGVKLILSLKNTGKQEFALTQRMQSCINSEPGVYSWPTPDWITIFRQTGEPLNGCNSFVYDLFRAGWLAKYYPRQKIALKFSFDAGIAKRLYSYLVQYPGFSTMEWYLKDYKIAPGKTAQFVFTAEILPEQGEFYADAHGKKQRVETIKPIKMPPVPAETQGSDEIRNFFCFSGSLGNLHQPELAGNLVSQGYTKQNMILQKRLTRILIDSYFNAVYPCRFTEPGVLKEARRETGRNIIGEMVRKYQAKIVPGYLFSNRGDIDPDKYMKETWPKRKAMLENKEFQQFIKDCSDVIPLYWTGDELLPQNADVMLRIHQELKAYLPEHVSVFPYLNSSSTALLPYLPVYLGDWYPIKRRWSSGRNPWNVYPEFSRIRKIAGDKPVWFMPQGFSGGANNGNGTYAFPTAGEIRLMLNLAAAAGVKGIAWHGFASGTWPWMMNYGMYRYALLGAGGQVTPSWAGAVECAKQFTAVSPLLLKAAPAAVPALVTLKSGSYKSFNGFYNDKAIKVFALKLSPGMLYIAINNNPYAAEKGELLLPAGKIWDLTNLRPQNNRRINLDLPPGGALYFGCGLSQKQLDEVFSSRFRAERARYLLLAEKAQGAKIAVVDPDSFKKNPPQKALALLLNEYGKLQSRLDKTPLGKVMKEMEQLQEKMDAMEFRLCCALELVVTPEMRKNTRRYVRWVAHPDKNYEQLRQRFAAVFARFYRIQDAIWEGKGIGNAEKELPAIKKEAISVIAGLNAWLDNHPEKASIDDPYENQVSTK